MNPLYSNGMHGFILDEVELGTRVAKWLDSENNTGWTAAHDASYEAYVAIDRAQQDSTTGRARVTRWPGGWMVHLGFYRGGALVWVPAWLDTTWRGAMDMAYAMVTP